MGWKSVEERRAYQRKYMADLRAWCKKNGRCRDCGNVDAYTMSGRVYCAECCERRNKQARERYHDDASIRDATKQRKKRLTEQRVKDGICTCCGVRKAAQGKRMCSVCTARGRHKNGKDRRADGIVSIEDRAGLGLCTKCGKPLDGAFREDGQPSKLCKACYQQACEALAAGREAQGKQVMAPFAFSPNSIVVYNRLKEGT